MGQIIVKDKAGKYAVWSTVTDSYIILHATRDELLVYIRDEAVKKADRELLEQLDLVDKTGTSSRFGNKPSYPPEKDKEY